jgi:hypothetical protein
VFLTPKLQIGLYKPLASHGGKMSIARRPPTAEQKVEIRKQMEQLIRACQLSIEDVDKLGRVSNAAQGQRLLDELKDVLQESAELRQTPPYGFVILESGDPEEFAQIVKAIKESPAVARSKMQTWVPIYAGAAATAASLELFRIKIERAS